MLSITRTRKQRFCRDLLAAANAAIGFADVGSGGALKEPWSLLPADRLYKFDFEPTGGGDEALPLCVSNQDGEANFYIAGDERASSFHRALPAFVERYGMASLYSNRTIKVRCVTLDQYFANRYNAVDALDVNVEGHDLQVLEGGALLLESGNIKLLKVEFELAAVWEGQGWMSDIDPLLRRLWYELAGMDVDHARPVSVRNHFHRGEPIWGKALYVPGTGRWSDMLDRAGSGTSAVTQAMAKGIALYIAADVPGRALDVLELHPQLADRAVLNSAEIAARVSAVYRWAKPEYGLGELWRIATRALRVRRPVSGA
jgi:FkbM family methyltransferase